VLWCHRCLRDVEPKKIATPTFDGMLIVEYYCPKCGILLETRKEKLELPSRKMPVGGLYVAFEGIDGCGKTYHATRLVERLEKEGYEVVYVKEPWIKEIKKFLYEHKIDPDAEVYIFATDRIILQVEVVLPALEEGKIVISERSIYASLSYQGAMGIPEEFIWAINRSIKVPDIVFLLDISAEEAMLRLKRERRRLTKYETLEFLRRVRERYLKIARKYKKSKFIVVDSTKDKEEVAKEIYEKLMELLEKY